jgi:hypothetical protein
LGKLVRGPYSKIIISKIYYKEKRLVLFLIIVLYLKFRNFDLFAAYTRAGRLSFPSFLFFRAKFFFAFLKRCFLISSNIMFFGRG